MDELVGKTVVAVTDDTIGWADQIVILDDGSRLVIESDYDGSTTTLLTAEQWIDRCHEYAFREDYKRFPDQYPPRKTINFPQVAAAMKEVWTSDSLVSQLYTDTPFLSGLDGTDRIGEYAVIPIKPKDES